MSEIQNQEIENDFISDNLADVNVEAENDEQENNLDSELKPKWYVIHTYSGYENKVKANIEKIVENSRLKALDKKAEEGSLEDSISDSDGRSKDKTLNIHEQIFEVSVPVQEEIVETKSGQKKSIKSKIYPGYVFVKMYMNADTWYVVRNTRGVTSFVGPGSDPVALSDQEAMNMGIEIIDENIGVEIGDRVLVTGGPFENSEGVIKEINKGKRLVTVYISIFGRETPVELAVEQIRQLD